MVESAAPKKAWWQRMSGFGTCSIRHGSKAVTAFRLAKIDGTWSAGILPDRGRIGQWGLRMTLASPSHSVPLLR